MFVFQLSTPGEQAAQPAQQKYEKFHLLAIESWNALKAIDLNGLDAAKSKKDSDFFKKNNEAIRLLSSKYNEAMRTYDELQNESMDLFTVFRVRWERTGLRDAVREKEKEISKWREDNPVSSLQPMALGREVPRGIVVNVPNLLLHPGLGWKDMREFDEKGRARPLFGVDYWPIRNTLDFFLPRSGMVNEESVWTLMFDLFPVRYSYRKASEVVLHLESGEETKASDYVQLAVAISVDMLQLRTSGRFAKILAKGQEELGSKWSLKTFGKWLSGSGREFVEKEATKLAEEGAAKAAENVAPKVIKQGAVRLTGEIQKKIASEGYVLLTKDGALLSAKTMEVLVEKAPLVLKRKMQKLLEKEGYIVINAAGDMLDKAIVDGIEKEALFGAVKEAMEKVIEKGSSKIETGKRTLEAGKGVYKDIASGYKGAQNALIRTGTRIAARGIVEGIEYAKVFPWVHGPIHAIANTLLGMGIGAPAILMEGAANLGRPIIGITKQGVKFAWYVTKEGAATIVTGNAADIFIAKTFNIKKDQVNSFVFNASSEAWDGAKSAVKYALNVVGTVPTKVDTNRLEKTAAPKETIRTKPDAAASAPKDTLKATTDTTAFKKDSTRTSLLPPAIPAPNTVIPDQRTEQEFNNSRGTAANKTTNAPPAKEFKLTRETWNDYKRNFNSAIRTLIDEGMKQPTNGGNIDDIFSDVNKLVNTAKYKFAPDKSIAAANVFQDVHNVLKNDEVFKNSIHQRLTSTSLSMIKKQIELMLNSQQSSLYSEKKRLVT